MKPETRHAVFALLALAPLAILETTALADTVRASDSETERFDLICTTIKDEVEGTLADGSPVVPGVIGEQRRYAFDLDARTYASNGRVRPIEGIQGSTLIKSDASRIESFGGVVHMRSDWRVDIESGLSIRRNRFYADAGGITQTGRSEWHQQCQRAPFSGAETD